MEKERIVLNDYGNEIDSYIRKVHRFNNRVNDLRPKFNEHVDGIGITLDSSWVKKIVHGRLRDGIGDHFYKFLQNQPKFMRTVIDQQFRKQIDPLYDLLQPLISQYNELNNTYPLPYEIKSVFEFAEDGTIIVEDDIKESIIEQIGAIVDNEKQHLIYEKFGSLFSSIDDLATIVANGNDDNYRNLLAALCDVIQPNGYNSIQGIEGVKLRSKHLIESTIKANR